MPTCVVCLNKRDNIPVGGTCANCNTPPKTDWFQYRNVKPLQPKRIMCVYHVVKTLASMRRPLVILAGVNMKEDNSVGNAIKIIRVVYHL